MKTVNYIGQVCDFTYTLVNINILHSLVMTRVQTDLIVCNDLRIDNIIITVK